MKIDLISRTLIGWVNIATGREVWEKVPIFADPEGLAGLEECN